MTKVFYIGDSTVQRNFIDTHPQVGMSQVLEVFLRPDVRVEAHGKNGRSTKSFLDEGRFEPVRRAMGEGDFLFIQFGHNDEKADAARHTEPWGSYQENLRFFIGEARSRGAYPVLITPIARRLFAADGSFRYGSHGEYPAAVRELGRQLQVPVADLTALTEAGIAALGDEPSRSLYVWPVDNTHLNYSGAVWMLRHLAAELERFGPPWSELLYRPEPEEPVIGDVS